VAAKLARIVFSVLYSKEPYDIEKLRSKPKLEEMSA